MNEEIEKLNNSLLKMESRMKELRSDAKVRAYDEIIRSYMSIKEKVENLTIEEMRKCEHKVVRIRTDNHRLCTYGCLKCGLTTEAELLYSLNHLPAPEVIEKTSLLEFKTMDIQQTLSSYPIAQLDPVTLSEFNDMRIERQQQNIK